MSRGFTLLEILLVLAIVGLTAGIAVPLLNRYVERTRIVDTTIEIGAMSASIKKFEAETGALPSSLADVGYGGKLDPWGHAYEYLNLVTVQGNGQARKDKKLAPLNSDFDLYSLGSDGVTHASLGNARSRDDVVRARDGKFIGLAEEFDP